MTTYTFTITATFDADDRQEAWDEWVDRLSLPAFVEDCTLVVTDDDPTNPDTIWHGLSPAAKRGWVEAMQPDPMFGPIEFVPASWPEDRGAM